VIACKHGTIIFVPRCSPQQSERESNAGCFEADLQSDTVTKAGSTYLLTGCDLAQLRASTASRDNRTSVSSSVIPQEHYSLHRTGRPYGDCSSALLGLQTLHQAL
jgi:hypothetical protein